MLGPPQDYLLNCSQSFTLKICKTRVVLYLAKFLVSVSVESWIMILVFLRLPTERNFTVSKVHVYFADLDEIPVEIYTFLLIHYVPEGLT